MAREMKNSGIEWVGSVPTTWNIVAYKYCCSLQAGYPFDSSLFSNLNGFPLIRIRDITSGTVQTFYTGEYDDSYIVHSGDLLVGMDGDFNIRWWLEKDALLNQRCCRIYEKENITRRFLYYVLPFTLGYINTLTYATTVKHLSNGDILNSLIAMPRLDIQKQITGYLDRICAEIDAVLEKTRTSIEEYKKLKQAIITQAVTKGIRGNRPMKGSGIEWIGEIPVDWEVYRGKRLFCETNERSETGNEELLTVSHITGITPRSQKNVNMFMSESLVGYKVCRVGDIAANTMWMWQGAIGVSAYHGVISPSYNTYRQRNGAFDSQYLDYLLRIRLLVDMYNACSTGITASRLRLYPEQFLSFKFPVPSMEEQQEIVRYLGNKVGEMNTLIQKKEQFLTELETYKKSLIYEYVTGKKEV